MPNKEHDYYRLKQDLDDPMSRRAIKLIRKRDRGATSEKRVRKGDQREPPEYEDRYMNSPALDRLKYELLRYCQGEINGVSILIAGQRGAGKTTLAKWAIQQITLESQGLIPLPVFLHGPTIIDSDAGTEQRENDWPAWRASDRTKASMAKERALPQIINALYRTLSNEIYEAWSCALDKAGDRKRPRSELQELRAHLNLILDRAPEADVLRKIWRRAGYLSSGVAFHLRPGPSKLLNDKDTLPGEPAEVAGDRKDQGLREIIALTSCADAYRAILGKTQERLRRSRSTEQSEQQSIQTPPMKPDTGKRSEDDRPIPTAAKLGPPALGILAGGLALYSDKMGIHSVFGLISGLGVWIASWATLTYGFRRQSSQQSRRDLTVEVDWSLERLDRDLPTLFRRVRDAGFAPIFVLDELDKSDDAWTKLDDFLRFAKHIVTEYAAFLFLTNRDYFEELNYDEQNHSGKR